MFLWPKRRSQAIRVVAMTDIGIEVRAAQPLTEYPKWR